MIIILQDKDLSETNKGKDTVKITIKDFPMYIYKFIKVHKQDIDLYFVNENDSEVPKTEVTEIATSDSVYYPIPLKNPV